MRWLLVLAFVPGIASAQGYCESLDDIAKQVMEARQNGVALRSLMDIVPDDPVLKEITVAAYDVPRFTGSPKHQRIAVTNFRDDIYQECLDATDNDE